MLNFVVSSFGIEFLRCDYHPISQITRCFWRNRSFDRFYVRIEVSYQHVVVCKSSRHVNTPPRFGKTRDYIDRNAPAGDFQTRSRKYAQTKWKHLLQQWPHPFQNVIFSVRSEEHTSELQSRQYLV